MSMKQTDGTEISGQTVIGLTVIGLTGGSGAGKSVVSAALEAHGIPVLDTDKVSRAVCEPNQPCLAALVREFGDGILNADGSLDRRGLAALVFGEQDETLRAQKQNALNKITHHFILKFCRAWIGEQYAEGNKTVCIDAPQLFESGFDRECTRIIGVTAARELRLSRIIARDFITREAAEARLSAQHDDAFFREHCDGIVENNGGMETVAPQVTALLGKWGLL